MLRTFDFGEPHRFRRSYLQQGQVLEYTAALEGFLHAYYQQKRQIDYTDSSNINLMKPPFR